MAPRQDSGSNVEPGLIQRAAAKLGYVPRPIPGNPGAADLPFGGTPGEALTIIPGVPTHADDAKVQPVTIPGIEGAWMSPLNPLRPSAPDGVRARALDLMVGWNITTNNQRGGQMDVFTLRNLARNCDMINLAIDMRKDQLEAGKFDFKLKDDSQGFKSAKDPRIKELRDFFAFPDKRRPLARWLRKLADDALIVDAPCIHIQRNRAGKPYAFRVIDTATIKPLIDENGESPMPPAPAYQQWLKGVPTALYSAGIGPDAVMTFDEMVWHPRNPRPDTLFGFSPVEQIAITVNTMIRRALLILAGYTEGTMPEALAPVPEGWTVEQIGAFQIYWAEMLAGKFGDQRGIRFVPHGMEKAIFTKKWEDHQEFDQWLARMAMQAYRLPNTWAINANNRASAMQQADTAEDEGRLPYLNYFCEMLTILVSRGFGYTDIEAVFKDTSSANEESTAKAASERLKTGQSTLNEERGARGADPYPDPAADVPMIITATGPVNITPPDPAAAQAEADDGQGKLPAPGDAKGQVRAAAAALKLAKKKSTDVSMKPLPGQARRLRELKKATAAFLKSAAPEVARRVSEWVHLGMGKADEKKETPDWSQYVLWAALVKVYEDALMSAGKAAALQALKAVGGSPEDSLPPGLGADASDVAPPEVGADLGQEGEAMAAAESDTAGGYLSNMVQYYARQRAAEMVGMKWVDGELVPNPNADMTISDSTRAMLQKDIEAAADENLSIDELAQLIEENYAFSAERSALIAENELAQLNMAATIQGWKASGQVQGKRSRVSPEHDEYDECDDNEEAGVIGLDEPFPDGNYGAPFHLRCHCNVFAVRINTTNDSQEEAA